MRPIGLFDPFRKIVLIGPIGLFDPFRTIVVSLGLLGYLVQNIPKILLIGKRKSSEF